MSHIVKSCPLTKLNGGLSRLHTADEDSASRLTNCSSRHAYEKKKCYHSCKCQTETVVKHFGLKVLGKTASFKRPLNEILDFRIVSLTQTQN